MNIKKYFINILQDQRKKTFLQYSISILLFILVIFMIFNFLSSFNSPSSNRYDKYDSASGRYIDTYKGTLTRWEDFVNINFLEDIQKAGMEIDSYDTLHTILEYFFTYSYPHIESLSIKKNSLKSINGTFNFILTSNIGQNFNIIANVPDNKKINIDIFSDNNKIYSYHSDFYQRIYDNKNLIDKILPKVLKLKNGTQFEVRKNYQGYYEISIMSCGNQTLNNEAREIINQWLESINLNKDDFNFLLPKRCDGDNKHHHH